MLPNHFTIDVLSDAKLSLEDASVVNVMVNFYINRAHSDYVNFGAISVNAINKCTCLV